MLLRKSSKYYISWDCLCSLKHPACNAHAPNCIVICGLPGCIIFFPHYLINGMIFEKAIENKMCFYFLYNFCLNMSHSKKNWVGYYKQVYWYSILSDFNETRIFSTDNLKVIEYQILWKSVQWEPSCLVRTDRRADMPELIAAFQNFANAPQN